MCSFATWPAPPSPRLRRTEPAIASERPQLADDGSVVYHLRRPFGDGTRAVRFDPLTFLEKLAALVPPPRAPPRDPEPGCDPFTDGPP